MQNEHIGRPGPLSPHAVMYSLLPWFCSTCSSANRSRLNLVWPSPSNFVTPQMFSPTRTTRPTPASLSPPPAAKILAGTLAARPKSFVKRTTPTWRVASRPPSRSPKRACAKSLEASAAVSCQQCTDSTVPCPEVLLLLHNFARILVFLSHVFFQCQPCPVICPFPPQLRHMPSNFVATPGLR